MGLGESDLLDDKDGGCKGASSLLSCSICFEVVMDVGERSWAKLQCGHRFHLDCIGSAFNAKGAMQCPNCRNIEKGQWLYSNGFRPTPDFSMEDGPHDDDVNEISYAELPFRVHWCPFSGLTSLPSSLEEGEFSSIASHPCPYIAYFGPIHPPSASSGSISDGSSFNNHWSGPSVPSEAPGSFAFHSMDAYCPWDQSSPFPTNARVGGADQASMPSMAQRTARNSSDISRLGVHPFVMGHRAPSPVSSSVVPHFSGNVTWPRERAPVQPHFQQSSNTPAASTPVIPTGRRSRVGLAPVAAAASSSGQQASGFYFLTSSSSSGRAFQEAENHHHNRFHGWGREYHQSSPLNLVDGDSIWAPFHPPGPGGASAAGRQRQVSDRVPQALPQHLHHHSHHHHHQ